MTLRVHVFFRTLRQATPTSNVNRNGKYKINYVDASDPHNWKVFQKVGKDYAWRTLKDP